MFTSARIAVSDSGRYGLGPGSSRLLGRVVPHVGRHLSLSACAYRKSHLGQEATAAYRLQIRCSGYLLRDNREAQEVHVASCEQRSLVVSGSEKWNTCPGVRIAARTATFRLRGARSGGEVRQLAVWQ